MYKHQCQKKNLLFFPEFYGCSHLFLRLRLLAVTLDTCFVTATRWSLSSPHSPAPSCLSVLCQLSSVLNLYPACCAGCIFPKCSSRNQCHSSFLPIVEILCARCPVSFLISCSKQSNLNRNSELIYTFIHIHTFTHTHTHACV